MSSFCRSLAFLAITAIAAYAQRPPGGFIPGEQRPVGDPAQVERGGKVYSVTCRACHGADLRGGDMGGPNLLRSQLSLSDKNGENIVPVINGSLAPAMPAMKMSPEDANAVAAYVRSVLATIQNQGKPPSTGKAPETVIVGKAAQGKAFFASKCASCHSVTGDMKGIATKYADAKVLQNTWVAGGSRFGRRPNVTAKVALPGGVVEGRVLRLDDFNVTLQTADGSQRTITRNGDVPRVDVTDPQKGHRDLLPLLTDANMHDVTAYLVTLK